MAALTSTAVVKGVMLKRHSQFLKSLLFCIDLGLICACWIGAYYLRFSEIVEPVTKGVPDLRIYLLLLVPIIAVWGMSFQAFDLYRPRRMGTRVAEFLDVAKANTLSVLILVAVTFFCGSTNIPGWCCSFSGC